MFASLSVQGPSDGVAANAAQQSVDSLLGACAAERFCPDIRRSRYHMQ